MKIKLPEHDHKLTNFLKVLLFSLLMLLPFLDIGTRCGYVLLNKNAYQSYSGSQSFTYYEKQATYEYGDLDNIELNKIYYASEFSNGDFNDLGDNETITMLILQGEVIDCSYDYSYVDEFAIDFIDFIRKPLELTFNGPSDCSIVFYADYEIYSALTINFENFFIDILGCYFIFTWADNTNDFNYILQEPPETNVNIYQYVENTISQSTLDNVFDYSIDKMTNSPLYKWTTSTGMYTGVNAMTTGLGITTPLFAILITYWMFLTIIYIILDIVLTLFTFMTHLFTSKKE